MANRCAQETEEQSRFLVQNVIRMSLASITYLRDLFDEKNFVPSTLGDVRVKFLQPSDEEPKTFHKWFDSTIPATLENGLLRKLCFGIASDPAGSELIEQYEFIVDYVGDQVALFEEKNREIVFQEAKKVVQSLLQFTENMAALPTQRYITVKAYYTYDYPCGGLYLSQRFIDPLKGLSMRGGSGGVMEIGTIGTAYHRLTVRVIRFDVATGDCGSGGGAVYRNGIKPSLQPERNLQLNVSLSPAIVTEVKHEKVESHGKLYKHVGMLPVVTSPEQEKTSPAVESTSQEEKKKTKKKRTKKSHNEPTEEERREVNKVFLSSPDKLTHRLTGIELLQILHNDAEKFTATTLGELVKRSPMVHNTMKMMVGTKERSRAVFLYPAFARLAKLHCIKLHPTDNGKESDIANHPQLYDKKGNLKSGVMFTITSFGRKLLNSPQRGRGRPLGSFKSTKSARKQAKEKKEKAEKAKEVIEIEDREPELKRVYDAIVVPEDFSRGDYKRLRFNEPMPRDCRSTPANYT